jgi:hypothetical protein
MFKHVDFTEEPICQSLAQAYAAVMAIKIPREQSQIEVASHATDKDDELASPITQEVTTDEQHNENVQLSLFVDLVPPRRCGRSPKRQQIEGKRRTGG